MEPEKERPLSEAREQPAQFNPIETLHALWDQYPASLGACVPLKIGSHYDLMLATGFTRRQVAHLMRIHCGGARYLARITAGAVRVDLQGNPAGLCTEAHEAASKERLERLNERRRQQRKHEQRASGHKGKKPVPMQVDPQPEQPSLAVMLQRAVLKSASSNRPILKLRRSR